MSQITDMLTGKTYQSAEELADAMQVDAKHIRHYRRKGIRLPPTLSNDERTPLPACWPVLTQDAQAIEDKMLEVAGFQRHPDDPNTFFCMMTREQFMQKFAPSAHYSQKSGIHGDKNYSETT